MSLLTIGSKAPDFSLLDQNGELRSLSAEKGKWVLIYFYPKDNTPGCNKQACAIRDSFPSFEKLNCVVFGISVDSETSHKKFEEKFKLPFTLLADIEKKAVSTYGVWREKSFLGKKYMGTVRSSFLINPEGNIARVYEAVKPGLHAEEVLADLQVLAS